MSRGSLERNLRRIRHKNASESLGKMVVEISKVSANVKPESGVPGQWVIDNFKIITDEMTRIKGFIDA